MADIQSAFVAADKTKNGWVNWADLQAALSAMEVPRRTVLKGPYIYLSTHDLKRRPRSCPNLIHQKILTLNVNLARLSPNRHSDPNPDLPLIWPIDLDPDQLRAV